MASKNKGKKLPEGVATPKGPKEVKVLLTDHIVSALGLSSNEAVLLEQNSAESVVRQGDTELVIGNTEVSLK